MTCSDGAARHGTVGALACALGIVACGGRSQCPGGQAPSASASCITADVLWIHVETELGSLDVPAGWNIWAHRGMMGEPVFGLTPDGHRGFAVVVHAQPAAVFDAHQDTVAAWLVRNAFLEPLDPGWAVTDWTCPSVGAGGSARESVTCVEGRAGPNIEVACSAVDDREMVYASARVQQGEVMEAIGGVSTLARIAASTAGLVQ